MRRIWLYSTELAKKSLPALWTPLRAIWRIVTCVIATHAFNLPKIRDACLSYEPRSHAYTYQPYLPDFFDYLSVSTDVAPTCGRRHFLYALSYRMGSATESTDTRYWREHENLASSDILIKAIPNCMNQNIIASILYDIDSSIYLKIWTTASIRAAVVRI